MIATRPFRFGVVATPHAGGDQWLATARRVAELGYSTLLMPDGMQLPAPFPALALAAGAAPVRIGTWVLAAPLRPALTTAWEAHSLTALTAGRFELGIGTGRPVVEQWTRALGLPFGSPGERLATVVDVVAHVRRLDGAQMRTPILIAASGPRARAVAAEHADIVAIASGATTPRQTVVQMLDEVRARAGSRSTEIEFVTSLFVVGNEVPEHVQRYLGAGLDELVAVDSLAVLQGTPQQMSDELQRRRDRLGTSYVTVSAEYLEQLAPVVERLAGV